MIDIRFLRENPEIVKQNIRNKFQDNKLPLVDEVIALDAESRKTQQEVMFFTCSDTRTDLVVQLRTLRPRTTGVHGVHSRKEGS